MTATTTLPERLTADQWFALTTGDWYVITVANLVKWRDLTPEAARQVISALWRRGLICYDSEGGKKPSRRNGQTSYRTTDDFKAKYGAVLDTIRSGHWKAFGHIDPAQRASEDYGRSTLERIADASAVSA